MKTVNITFEDEDIKKLESNKGDSSWRDFFLNNFVRLKDLEEFSSEVKKLAHNVGKSNSISKDDLEVLFQKFNVRIL